MAAEFVFLRRFCGRMSVTTVYRVNLRFILTNSTVLSVLSAFDLIRLAHSVKIDMIEIMRKSLSLSLLLIVLLLQQALADGGACFSVSPQNKTTNEKPACHSVDDQAMTHNSADRGHFKKTDDSAVKHFSKDGMNCCNETCQNCVMGCHPTLAFFTFNPLSCEPVETPKLFVFFPTNTPVNTPFRPPIFS